MTSIYTNYTVVKYNEWMLYSFQDLLLIFNVVNMFALDDLSFFHALDRVFVIRLCFKPADADITECT